MRKNHANFVAKKRAQEPIVMVTCYDYPTAQMEDAAGIDIIFVGDSVGTNVLGYAAETEVTMADMLHHLKAVRRGVQAAYLLVDLPYGAYDTPQLALANARRLVQGRSLAEGQALLRSALALEQAGVSLLVLELVNEPISQLITQQLRIPTIGIGSGRFCDGQVLVSTDLLGISTVERKLMKRYERLRERSIEALTQFKQEVQQRRFPTEANAFYKIALDEVAQLVEWVHQGMPGDS